MPIMGCIMACGSTVLMVFDSVWRLLGRLLQGGTHIVLATTTEGNRMKGISNTEQLRELPILLSIQQTADILQCSQKHCRDLCREGQIVAAKCGTSWRINRDKLLAQFGLA